MEMGDQYGLPDLRQFMMAGRAHIPTFSQATDQFPSHRNLTAGQHYEIMMLGRQVGEVLPRGVADFRSDSTNSTTNTTTAAAAAASVSVCGFEMEGCMGGDGGNGRWPRQETLTLLEIRSRLDPKFKEANQKGPLWDEVSRIMAEEHGYQRSGKKCREKFENLYKYYKKTKESKAGRQDGKHYRFFRQLEALYGELNNPVSVSETHVGGNLTNIRFQSTNNTISTQSNQEGFQAHQKLSESLSISNSSEFHTSSSEDDDNDLTAIGLMDNDSIEKKKMKDTQSLKRGRKSWKAKIRDFVDSQMRKLMERQEAWLEKMLKTLEHKEQERMSRVEEWRKQEAARIDREHKLWDNERAWFKARDAALMEALKKFTGREVDDASLPEKQLMETELHENNVENQNENGSETMECTNTKWPEAEISSLIHLRTSMEPRFQQGECSNGALWEEISSMMTCLGYNWNAKRCEEKWESVEKYVRRTKECNKKRKENYSQGGAFCGHGINDQVPETMGIQLNDDPSPSNSNAGGGTTIVNDSCFRFLMAEGENVNVWETYGMKLNKGENQ